MHMEGNFICYRLMSNWLIFVKLSARVFFMRIVVVVVVIVDNDKSLNRFDPK